MGKYIKTHNTKSEVLSDSGLVTSSIVYCEENKQVNIKGNIVKDIKLVPSLDETNKIKLGEIAEPLTFDVTSNGTISFSLIGGQTVSMYSRLNDGAWTSWNGSAITVASGDRLSVKGNNSNGLAGSRGEAYTQFVITAMVKAHGNIMSLLDETMERTNVPDYGFFKLFMDCTTLVTPPSMPATAIGEYAYANMYNGTDALMVAPDLSSMISMGDSACYNMFYHSGIRQATELNAMYIPSCGYQSMFERCVNLKYGPTVLPATIVSNQSYASMFEDCTSLIYGPKIMTKRLDTSTCDSMFMNCTSLRFIHCNAVEYNNNKTLNWVNGITREDGIFVKSSQSNWQNGDSGIPTKWEVRSEGETWVTETVDLDLSSGNLWTSCNIGSKSPINPGRYFAWGDVEGSVAGSSLDKFNKEWWDENIVASQFSGDLANKFQAPKYFLGDDFYVPSDREYEELLNETDISTVTVSGVECLRFASKKNAERYILIPLAGHIVNGSLVNIADIELMTSVDNSDIYGQKAKFVTFTHPNTWTAMKYFGTNIRAVRK